MLLAAVVMFVISAICYSYAISTESFTLAVSSTYPYRTYAIPFISTGTILMGIASFSYSKKSKQQF